MIATTLYHYEFIGYIKISLDKKKSKFNSIIKPLFVGWKKYEEIE